MGTWGWREAADLGGKYGKFEYEYGVDAEWAFHVDSRISQCSHRGNTQGIRVVVIIYFLRELVLVKTMCV